MSKDSAQYIIDTKLQPALASIVLHCLDHNEKDAVANFESIVADVFAPKVSVVDDPLQLASWNQTNKMFKIKVPKEEGDEGGGDGDGGEAQPAADEEPEGENEASSIPDTLGDLSSLEWAGVGFGRQEAFRIHLALLKLAKKEPVDVVRFWGKVLGTEKNYYVAEVVFKDGERGQGPSWENKGNAGGDEEQPPAEEEEEGKTKDPGPIPREDPPEGGDVAWVQNPNQYVYFVCHEPGAPWYRLPDVTPAQITAARKLKRMFTGDLSRKVPGVAPPFPGFEREYLRAQIARIKHATAVGPRGLLLDSTEEGAEEPTVDKNEEFQPVPFDELKNLSMGGWVHLCREILPQGRCGFVTWPPKEEEEEEDEEAASKRPPPYVEKNAQPLRSLHLDQGVGRFGVSSWSVRPASNLIGDYSAVVARSNRWPGSNSVVFGNKVTFCYVGYGLKATGGSHVSPVMPIMQEIDVEALAKDVDDLHLQPPPPPEEQPEE